MRCIASCNCGMLWQGMLCDMACCLLCDVALAWCGAFVWLGTSGTSVWLDLAKPSEFEAAEPSIFGAAEPCEFWVAEPYEFQVAKWLNHVNFKWLSGCVTWCIVLLKAVTLLWEHCSIKCCLTNFTYLLLFLLFHHHPFGLFLPFSLPPPLFLPGASQKGMLHCLQQQASPFELVSLITHIGNALQALLSHMTMHINFSFIFLFLFLLLLSLLFLCCPFLSLWV